jgi:hypothetical protein
MTAEPLGIGCSYDDLIRFVRERAVAMGMTDVMIVEFGGFTPGHVGKLLGAKRTKNLGPLTLGMMLGALGLKFAIIEDAEATARIRSRYEPSEKSKRVLSDAQTPRIEIGSAIAQQLLRDMGRENGRAGALAFMQKTTPFQRSQSARKAAKARWKKGRKPSMGTF